MEEEEKENKFGMGVSETGMREQGTL